jgi:hypothetical protein
MIPALASGAAASIDMAEKAAVLAGASHTAAVAQVELMEAALLTSGAPVSKNYAKWAEGLAGASDKTAHLHRMNKSLNASIRYQQGIVQTGNAAQKKAAIDKIALLQLEQAQLKLTTQAELGRGAASIASANATALATAEKAVALEIIALTNKEQKMGATWKAISAATDKYTAALAKNSAALASNNILVRANARAMIFLKGAIFKVRKALGLLKISLIELLLPIALLIIAAGALYAIWKWIFRTEEVEKYREAMDDLHTLFDEMPAKVDKYNEALGIGNDLAAGQVRQYQIQSGMLTELHAKMKANINVT